MDGTRRRYGGIGYLNGFHIRGRLKTGYNYHCNGVDVIILMYEPVSRTVTVYIRLFLTGKQAENPPLSFSDGLSDRPPIWRNPMNEHVLLLHGIHMHAWTMLPFARLLKQQGLSVQTFGYYSIWQKPEQHCAALTAAAEDFFRRHQKPLHFVGHSLGGLVLRRFAAARPDLVRGRIVTLGTPHQGSTTAETIRNWGAGTPLLGGAYRNMLDGNLPDLPPGIELGSLAGNSPLGIGRIFKLQGENDGTVLVEETRFPGMADHILLPVSHTGMLTDKRVAGQTAAFLRHGKFDR